jgi:hypothetical protein
MRRCRRQWWFRTYSGDVGDRRPARHRPVPSPSPIAHCSTVIGVARPGRPRCRVGWAGGIAVSPDMVAQSVKHDGSAVVLGIKDSEGNWNQRPHRLMDCPRHPETLGPWHAVLETDDIPVGQTRMVYAVNKSTAMVLEKLAAEPPKSTTRPATCVSSRRCLATPHSRRRCFRRHEGPRSRARPLPPLARLGSAVRTVRPAGRATQPAVRRTWDRCRSTS